MTVTNFIFIFFNILWSRISVSKSTLKCYREKRRRDDTDLIELILWIVQELPFGYVRKNLNIKIYPIPEPLLFIYCNSTYTYVDFFLLLINFTSHIIRNIRSTSKLR